MLKCAGHGRRESHSLKDVIAAIGVNLCHSKLISVVLTIGRVKRPWEFTWLQKLMAQVEDEIQYFSFKVTRRYYNNKLCVHCNTSETL